MATDPRRYTLSSDAEGSGDAQRPRNQSGYDINSILNPSAPTPTSHNAVNEPSFSEPTDGATPLPPLPQLPRGWEMRARQGINEGNANTLVPLRPRPNFLPPPLPYITNERFTAPLPAGRVLTEQIQITPGTNTSSTGYRMPRDNHPFHSRNQAAVPDPYIVPNINSLPYIERPELPSSLDSLHQAAEAAHRAQYQRERRRRNTERMAARRRAANAAQETDIQFIGSAPVMHRAPSNTSNKHSSHSSRKKSPVDAKTADSTPAKEPKKNKFKVSCVICMDEPVDWTATKCGHVFCYECLMQALIAKESESRRLYGRPVGACPTCRTPIDRQKAGEVIPMLLMVTPSVSDVVDGDGDEATMGGSDGASGGKGKERVLGVLGEGGHPSVGSTEGDEEGERARKRRK